jgi:hypothetical protein
MINDLFHWLLATFLFSPIQAEIDGKLQAAQAPRAVVEQARSCVAAATPELVRRAGSDWFWGTTTVISVATGIADPMQVLSDEVPACRHAVEVMRPFLRNDNRA